MLEETDVSLCIKDDIGRTPLHDAAWTSEPNFGLVELILRRCPDLLYVKDKRGHTPFSYIGKKNWGDWCTFMEMNPELVIPKILR